MTIVKIAHCGQLHFFDLQFEITELISSMENNLTRGDSANPWIVRIVTISCFTAGLIAILTSLAIREWTSENLLKSVMIGATFLLSGIFLIIGLFYHRFAAGKIESVGWRRTFVCLYVLGIALLHVVGLVSLFGVLAEGRWSGIAGPLTLLAIAVYNAFVLLPPMWRKVKTNNSFSQV